MTLLLCLGAITFSHSQSSNSRVEILMKTAQKQMAEEDYEQANLTFRKILSSKSVIPNNLTYLFAETLYMIDQYENSHNFLKKYFTLTGKAGDYYKEALQLEALLDEQLDEIRSCKYCDAQGYRLTECSVCNQTGEITEICYYCKGKGVVNCLTCQGLGVTITESVLGEKVYQGCPKCSGHGHHACDTCKGDKTLKNQCPTCLGSLHESTQEICNHEEISID